MRTRKLRIVNAERGEPLHLVHDLPEAQAPQAPTEVYCHLAPMKNRTWPPAFFASAPGDDSRIANQADELLREGFGC